MVDWLLAGEGELRIAENDVKAAHARIGAWVLENKEADFSLRHGLLHLDAEHAEGLLLDFSWLLKVAEAGGAAQLVLDAVQVQGLGKDATLVARAIEKGLHALVATGASSPASSSAASRRPPAREGSARLSWWLFLATSRPRLAHAC